MKVLQQMVACAILAVLCAACNRPAPSPVLIDDVKAYLQPRSVEAEWNIAEADCKTPADTIYRNLPYTFTEALEQLQLQFKRIDSLGYNPKTTSLLKALVVGDFTYAAFSFQFLGPGEGLETDTLCEWNAISLADFYNLGNTNQTSLYCVERTAFFLRLTDSLLHIKGMPVAITDFHTYPVLYIQGDTFIIDPYDPFIVSDSSGIYARTYSDLLNSPDAQSFVPLRTKRLYGNTHQLISQRFTDSIEVSCHADRNSCLCESLRGYLFKNEAKLRGFVRPCFNLPDQPLYSTLRIVGSGGFNSYSMEMTGRVDGQLSSGADLLRYYAGRMCDTAFVSK